MMNETQSVQELQKLIEAKTRQRTELERQLQETGEKITPLLKQYEDLVLEVPFLKREKEESLKQLSCISEEIATLNIEFSRLQGQLKPYKDLTEDIQTLTAEKEVLKRDNLTLSNENEVLKTDHEILKTDIRVAETRLSELKSDAEKVVALKATADERERAIDTKILHEESVRNETKTLTEANEKAVEDLNRFPNSIGYYIKGLQTLLDKKGVKVDVMQELQKL